MQAGATDQGQQTVTITAPAVSGAQVGQAVDVVADLLGRYDISRADADALFNGMVSIYVRQRMVYGDRAPSACSLADCLGETPA